MVIDTIIKKATIENKDIIYHLVQDTIRTIYPKYYPIEVVDFFSQLHSKEKIEKDIKNGFVSILMDKGDIVATGSYKDNYITRVYVKPEYQGKGYGSYIMQSLEDEIAINYESVCLDASFPACSVYEHRGYETRKHDQCKCNNGAILVYAIMEKKLKNKSTENCVTWQ